ncbi:hypothetical protein L6452_32824 [Arctium lappa]|uniref:Uncharacterized protein n=1 Tax=Arctium lappa TaxID=4217 RepID=A0ACB8Z5W5_ARCLA|nr:hypothetical protein L6452_32824 [Arctium lappa]
MSGPSTFVTYFPMPSLPIPSLPILSLYIPAFPIPTTFPVTSIPNNTGDVVIVVFFVNQRPSLGRWEETPIGDSKELFDIVVRIWQRIDSRENDG